MRWQRLFFTGLVIVICLSLLLPVNYSLFTGKDLVHWFKSDKPFILNIEELNNQSPVTPDINPQSHLKENPESSGVISTIIEVFLVLIILSVLIVVIGFLLNLIIKDIKKSGNLISFFIKIYLSVKNLVKDIFSRAGKISFNKFKIGEINTSENKEEFTGDRERNITGDFQSLSLRKLIFRIYHLLQKLLSGHGIEKSPYQTPYEYCERVSGKFPGVRKEIRKITDIYVEMVYSQHTLQENVRSFLLTIWENLREKLVTNNGRKD